MMVTERQQLLDTLQMACENAKTAEATDYGAIRTFFATVDTICDYAKTYDDFSILDEALYVMCGGDDDESD
jgi:hypothetical protein